MMRCPYCGVSFFKNFSRYGIGVDIEGPWNYLAGICPECKKLILCLEHEKNLENTTWDERQITANQPKIISYNIVIPDDLW